MIYDDQFLQFCTKLPSTNIYGLGEHVSRFRLNTQWSTISQWARDCGTPDGQFTIYNLSQ